MAVKPENRKVKISREKNMVREALDTDIEKICGIYNYYIQNTVITFEEEPVTAFIMKERVKKARNKFAWFVFEKDNDIEGYCYATEWRERSAYRFSAETTVYVKNGYHGQGTGTELYKALIDFLKEKGIHTMIAGIALPNAKSQGLHEKMGFRKTAEFVDVGFKFGKWVSVGYWQKIL